MTATNARSYSNLAHKIGVSRQAVYDWRDGKSLPGEAAMLRLADRAKLDPQEALILRALWQADTEAKQVYRDMLKKFTAITGGIIFALSLCAGNSLNVLKTLENNAHDGASAYVISTTHFNDYAILSRILRRIWRAICTCKYMRRSRVAA